MLKRLLAIVFIFLGATLAWSVLGGTILARTYSSDSALKSRVERIWGTEQAQRAPEATLSVPRTQREESVVDGKKIVTTRTVTEHYPLPLIQSRINVNLGLDYRQKGLLWYSTYVADFNAGYRFRNDTGLRGPVTVVFPFPAAGANYHNFRLALQGGDWREKPVARNGQIEGVVALAAGEEIALEVAYRSQGLDRWRYLFAGEHGAAEVRDFALTMETDFRDIDFPDDSIAPTVKTRTDTGWRLDWQYDNLIAGVNIGMLLPQKLQPGPLAGQISLFAPVSLFFFIVVMLVLSVVRRIDLHPMHFFFVSAAFFAFHLLLGYLVDHLSIHLAFAIASAVSLALVASYLRAVIGTRFACAQAAGAQFVFLVLFSYAFFFKGFTGLAITVGAVLTLFLLMRLTAGVDWSAVFARK